MIEVTGYAVVMSKAPLKSTKAVYQIMLCNAQLYSLDWCMRNNGACHILVINTNMALNRSLCFSDDTLKAVGPFYLVSMPGEVKYPTQGINV